MGQPAIFIQHNADYNFLIDFFRLDGRANKVQRIFRLDDVIGLYLVDFRDGAGVLLLIFHQQLFTRAANPNHNLLFDGFRPVVQHDGFIVFDGQLRGVFQG